MYEEEIEDYSDIHPDFLNMKNLFSFRYKLLVVIDFFAKVLFSRAIPYRERIIRTSIETLLFVNYQKSIAYNLFLGVIFILIPSSLFLTVIILSFIDAFN